MSLVSKQDLRSMAERLVPRIAPPSVAQSEDVRVAEHKLQEDARRMLKEMMGPQK